jgi:outer membrane protein assembly factor BamB
MNWRSLLVVAATVMLAACKSSSSPKCNTAGGTTLAPTTWPKFRADPANSGRAMVDLTASQNTATLVFDGSCFAGNMHTVQTTQTCTVDESNCPCEQICKRIGPVSTTPILGPAPIGEAEGDYPVFLASSDGNVYAFNRATPTLLGTPTPGATPTPVLMQVTGAILGSPLLGTDGVLVVPSNGLLTQFNPDNTIDHTTILTGFAAASPNIWNGDGTVYVGTQTGNFQAVCANGVARFAAVVPLTQSAPVVAQDPNQTQPMPIIAVGGINGQVRSYNLYGNQIWSFFASANIVAALMVDETTNLFYTADTAGRVFAANLANGELDSEFSFTAGICAGGSMGGMPCVTDANCPSSTCSVASITASPALGRDSAEPPRLYVADQGIFPERGGVLYALYRDTGAVQWMFEADGPINSSPAVATGGMNDVIILAADIIEDLPDVGPVAIGGRVYAVQDDGDHPTLLWTFDPGHAIGASSPAIGPDGTIYIGRTGGRLGTADECKPMPTPCLVNDGGALYAINRPVGPTPTAQPTCTAPPTPTATP